MVLRSEQTSSSQHSGPPFLNVTSAAAAAAEQAKNSISPDPLGAAKKDDDDDGDPIRSDSDCALFGLVLYVFVFGLICVFGIIGNVISFVVLRWERHCHVATFLLQVLACADNLFLATTGFSTISTALIVYREATGSAVSHEDHPVMAYVTVLVWPLVHITQMWTIWITVIIAFNRYVAICLPFQAPMLCTMRQARIQVTVAALVIALYNVPRFLEHHIVYVVDEARNVTVPRVNTTDLKNNEKYNIIYENALYCLFVFSGPLFILVVMNAGLIRELLLARRRLLTRQLPAALAVKDHEQNLTLVMVVIVIVFVVCQTPAFINQLLFYAVADTEYVCGVAYYYYFHVSNVAASTNSAVNFIVYCVFRRQFREKLQAFCSRQHHHRHHGGSSAYNRYSDGYPLKHTGHSSYPSVYSRSTSIQIGGNTSIGLN